MFDILHISTLEAGKILLKYFEKELSIKQKTSHHDIVTQADVEAQEVIMKTICSEAEKHGIDKKDIGFIGEEGSNEIKKYTFIIDPLDGTSNFSSRIDYFGVSIACFKEGKPFAGLIYRPTTDELYYAEKEKGAFKIKKSRKTKLHIEPNDIKTGFLLTNISSSAEVRSQILAKCDRLMEHFKNIRVYGAIAVDATILADNKCSAILYGKSGLWDIAAGLIIIRESGGEVYDLNGRIREVDISDKFKKYPFFAVHPTLLNFFLQKLS